MTWNSPSSRSVSPQTSGVAFSNSKPLDPNLHKVGGREERGEEWKESEIETICLAAAATTRNRCSKPIHDVPRTPDLKHMR